MTRHFWFLQDSFNTTYFDYLRGSDKNLNSTTLGKKVSDDYRAYTIVNRGHRLTGINICHVR